MVVKSTIRCMGNTPVSTSGGRIIIGQIAASNLFSNTEKNVCRAYRCTHSVFSTIDKQLRTWASKGFDKRLHYQSALLLKDAKATKINN